PLAASHPFNINAMQERMQILLQDPRFERLNADLRPGLKPGESVLNVQVVGSRDALPLEPGGFMPSPLYRLDSPPNPACKPGSHCDNGRRAEFGLAGVGKAAILS